MQREIWLNKIISSRELPTPHPSKVFLTLTLAGKKHKYWDCGQQKKHKRLIGRDIIHEQAKIPWIIITPPLNKFIVKSPAKLSIANRNENKLNKAKNDKILK